MGNATERAYAQIKAAILEGRLAPGNQVREEEVAALCGVSRTPVRDALRRLEAEMFVERSETQRSYVSIWTPEDVAELFTLRALLESHAAERAAANITPEILAGLRRTLAGIAAAIAPDAPDVEAFVRHNHAFHRLIIQAAGSERLAAMIARLIVMPVVHRTVLGYSRAELGRSLAEHEEIVAALENRDAQWAGALMTAHIRRAYHTHLSATKPAG